MACPARGGSSVSCCQQVRRSARSEGRSIARCVHRCLLCHRYPHVLRAVLSAHCRRRRRRLCLDPRRTGNGRNGSQSRQRRRQDLPSRMHDRQRTMAASHRILSWQIVFAVVAPGNVVANVIAGAIAEAGAIQAGDMMQDFKTAHLVGEGLLGTDQPKYDGCFASGVPPRPQFFAQIIGSFASVFLSVGVYVLYTTAWDVPGEELPVPSAEIWLDMARLFNGGSLPDKVGIFAALFAVATAAVVATDQWQHGHYLASFLPSGIGFAVGMYVGPKYTIPRLLGSLAEQLWKRHHSMTHNSLMVVVASGLVLGEGTGAIVVAFVRMFQATV